MDYKKLLEKLKEYKGDGSDYLHTTHELGNGISGEIYEEEDIYRIYSPQLKKQAREIIFFGNSEDGGLCEVGTKDFDKHWNYKKGKGDQPDEFKIEINPKKDREETKPKKLHKTNSLTKRRSWQNYSSRSSYFLSSNFSHNFDN